MLSRSRRLIVPSACLAFALFFLVPSLLYQGGASTAGLSFGNFLVVSLPVSVVASAVFFVVALAVRPWLDLGPWLTGISLAVIIKAVLLPSAAPVLDGETSFVAFATAAGVWSVASIILALGAAAFVSWRWGASIAGGLLIAILAMGSQPLLASENWAYRNPKSNFADVSPFMEFSRDQDNVLVLLVDTFQSDVFAELVHDDPKLKAAFDGFTLFHNTVANAPYTLLAMMPIYSGRIYDGGSLRDFYQTVREDSLFTDFESMGYETALGGHHFYGICPAQRCYSQWDFTGERALEGDFSKYIGIWDVSVLRITPTFLHEWIYNSGKGRTKALFPITDPGPSGWSIAVLNAISSRLSLASQKPTLKFVHVMITHSPIVLTEECKPGKQRQITRPNYKRQALCAVRTVVRLLDALREKGLYDNTTIVLMADHGASISGQPPQDLLLEQVRPQAAATGGRFNPLFSIKPKQASGALQVSSAPLLLSDLRATLCGMAKTCKPDVPGHSAWDLAPNAERNRSFIDYGSWAHRYSGQHGTLPLDRVVHYTIGGSSEALMQTYDPKKRRALEKQN